MIRVRQRRWLHYLVAFLCGAVLAPASIYAFNWLTFLALNSGPSPVTIVGEVRLQPGQYRAINEQDASKCTGVGAFFDVAPGASVDIVDKTDSRLVLGRSGNLGLAEIIGDAGSTSTCVMRFELSAGDGRQFYGVKVGRHVVSYSAEQVRSPLVVTFDR